MVKESLKFSLRTICLVSNWIMREYKAFAGVKHEEN